MKFNSEQIKYILMTLSNTPSSDIDSDEFDVEWGSDDGVEGFAAHSISDTAGNAIECIESIEQQRDDLLAALRVAEGFVSEVSEKTGFGQVHTLKLIQAAITKITGETK